MLEPAHGTISLLDAAMILLQMVIQVAIGPVHDPVPEDLPNGTWVGIVAIGGNPVGRHAGHSPGRAEEGLSCREVSGIASRASIKWPFRSIARYR